MKKLYVAFCVSLLILSLATAASATVNLVDDCEGYTSGSLAGQVAPNGQTWVAPYSGWATSMIVAANHGLTGLGMGGNGNTDGVYGWNTLMLGETITSGKVRIGADIRGDGAFYHQFGLSDTVSGKELYIGYTAGVGRLWFDGIFPQSIYGGPYVGISDFFRLDMVIDLDNRMADVYWSGAGGTINGTWNNGPWSSSIAFQPNKLVVYTYQAGGSSIGSFDNLTLQMVPEPGSVLALGAGLFSLIGFAVRRRK